MSPDEVQGAVARILMRAAGPADDVMLRAISDELAAFDGVGSITDLAVATAAQTAAKLQTVGTSLLIADSADLLAFGMITIALEHGPEQLPCYLDGLGYTRRAGVAIALLAMWRQACSTAAVTALAGLRIPATIPEEQP